jgi:hypothetical protein
MRKIFATILILALSPIQVASAAPTKFSSCKVMNKYFPGGVTTPGAVNGGKQITLLPFPSRSIYLQNRSLDSDRDGIACER